MTFYQSNSFLSLTLVDPLKLSKFHTDTRKVFFPSISVMGWFRVIKNSVKFNKECSNLSPQDKITKNESKMEFYTRFQKVVCVFFKYSDFLVKLKPNEKAV
jgi:hypothetical protein